MKIAEGDLDNLGSSMGFCQNINKEQTATANIEAATANNANIERRRARYQLAERQGDEQLTDYFCPDQSVPPYYRQCSCGFELSECNTCGQGWEQLLDSQSEDLLAAGAVVRMSPSNDPM